ncbi:MAG: hypothetical protein IPL78_32920 [Chloroflexi bacterium]|nr:hypothetical protein [Chloroflexota bacterium]
MEETKPAETLPTTGRNWETLALIPLVLIILLGAYFRFTGLDWDGSNHLHPDERFLTIVSAKLQSASGPLEYLQTSKSPLNPYNANEGFYVYGNFPLTVTRKWWPNGLQNCASGSPASIFTPLTMVFNWWGGPYRPWLTWSLFCSFF